MPGGRFYRIYYLSPLPNAYIRISRLSTTHELRHDCLCLCSDLRPSECSSFDASLLKIMRNQSSPSSASPVVYLLLLLTLFFLAKDVGIVRVAEGGKKKVHIPDELDDVIDDEEDESWRQWGQKSSPSQDSELEPPPDFSTMDPSQIQAEMIKRQTGPSYGFVKLRLGVKRSPDMVADIAMKWTKVLKTGSIEVKFMSVDLSTIMFTMQRGKDTTELKEFILNQPDAYEIKIGDHIFRRPGDPPLEEVFKKLHDEQGKTHDYSSTESSEQLKSDEL